jgi:polyhydroxybutyrate depolymerase
MRHRKLVFRMLAVLVGVPLLAVLGSIVFVIIANRTNGIILSDGEEREYLLHVPATYDPSRPTPLVVSLHGAMTWPAFQRDQSGWSRLADEEGFLVAYPSGTGALVKTWRMEGPENPQRMPDVRFIAALVDTLEAAYNVDPARIYVDGMSNGGGMAFVLSCTLARRIAAVGSVSAAPSLPWSWCEDPTPIPMIAFHGTGDPLVPYGGGRGSFGPDSFPDVRAWAASWAERNRCQGEAVGSEVAEGVSLLEYSGCEGDAAVALYTLRGGGHQWPGGKPLPGWLVGPWIDAVDATRLIWEFFLAHPRSRASTEAGTSVIQLPD